MSMTKKDFEVIAKGMRFAWARGDLKDLGLNRLAVDLGQGFQQSNPRFNMTTFLNACGVMEKKSHD